METFAAYTAQTDYEVGRLLDAVEQIGQMDNTLIFWEIGDNGASMEGTLNGVLNEMASLNGAPEDTSYVLQHIEEIGGPQCYNHFPVGWAWAMNTPFQWGKQVAWHFGGTRNPLVISWPKRIKHKGGVRTQFHHVIDIEPTILEAAGIPEPSEVNGVTQKPLEGISMVYSFDDANAKEQRHTQYFEMFGNRAIYDDGWIAACRHGRLPWQTTGSFDFARDRWELYNLDQDFSEANDLSARNPEKLKALQDLFWVEAAKYNVLPLDDRFAERADPSLRPSLIAGRAKFTYFAGAVRIPESSAANVKNRSYTITAYVEFPESGADGVLVAAGGTVAGYTLYTKSGRPTYEYNWFSQTRYKVTSSEKLQPGPATIRVEFTNSVAMPPLPGPPPSYALPQ
jgi:arylsulfatase